MSGDRMLELLTEQTERPLSAHERAELDRLLADNPKWRATDFELAAASTALAFLGKPEEMPAGLADRVMDEIMGGMGVEDTVTIPAQKPLPPPREIHTAKRSPGPAERSRIVQYGGWVMAAAAVILLAIVIGWPKPKPDAAGLRATLLAKRTAVRSAWTNTEDPLSPGTTGDVVWDNETQTGFMRFRGLGINDPTKNQYQLWIFDKNRSDKHPVDGGVFDIAENGDVLIPINAKIRVFDPVMFAVTLERPGGVVVSDRERLVVLAKVKQPT